MEDASQPVVTCACPHVDQNDARCGAMFSLGRIDRVFAMCMDGYRRCPIYHLLTREERLERARLLPSWGEPVPSMAGNRLNGGYVEVRIDHEAVRNAIPRLPGRLHKAAS